MPDPGTMIRELRPHDSEFDPDAPAARAALERILAEPPLPTRRRHRVAPRIAFAAATCALAAAVVAAVPFLRDDPDVVARAAAALAAPDTILHLTAEVRARESAAELRAGRPDDHVDAVVESWQGEGRSRSVTDDREIVLETSSGRGEAFLGTVNALVRINLPGSASGLSAPTLPSGVVGDLARLLERARAGEADVRLVGETTVRGVPVYELRLDFTFRPADGGKSLAMSRTIYVDRDSYLPVRVVEQGPDGEVYTVTDYVRTERLPVDAETRSELRMSPHPGAQRQGADGGVTFRIPDRDRR